MDSMRCIVQSDLFSKVADSPFGCTVGGYIARKIVLSFYVTREATNSALTALRSTHDSQDRRHIDNPATVPRGVWWLFQHLSQGVLAAQKYRLGIDTHREVPRILVRQV